ncbi:MAG: 30S ribosomal protein S18 [Candidatus Levybacteria bacterium]|nr:30S ribosomal protein S18 [Candidatus Levybacteria bacterium]
MKARRRPKPHSQKIEPCFFCKEKKEPSFHDIAVLRRYLTDRNKIVPRSRSGLCAKHQRNLTRSIKHARYLALLPYVPTEN